MRPPEYAETMLDAVPYAGQTGVADDDSLALLAQERQGNREAWQQIIDSTLIEWGRDPAQLEDEGVTAPAGAIIDRANELAMILRDEGWAPPKRVVTSPDGGVVFERWDGPVLEQIEITEKGEILVTCFEHSRLAHVKRLA